MGGLRAMPEAGVGLYVLVYQKFVGEAEPQTPFEARILEEVGKWYWRVRYVLTDKSTTTRRINKGCCSTSGWKKAGGPPIDLSPTPLAAIPPLPTPIPRKRLPLQKAPVKIKPRKVRA